MYNLCNLITGNVVASDAMLCKTEKMYNIDVECEILGSEIIERIISHTDAINVNILHNQTTALVGSCN